MSRDDVESTTPSGGPPVVEDRKADAYDEFPGADRDRPWDDADLLRRLYTEESLSMWQISKGWDCSPTTVRKYILEHGIPKRSRSEAAQAWRGTRFEVPLSMHSQGTMCWQTSGPDGDGCTVYVHRLLAVALWGFDAVCDMDVHHKNEIRWDNRPENLELLTHAEHRKRHRKVSGVDRLRLAELYENGDISSRDLADHFDHDITMGTVLDVHKEFYGGDDE